MAGDDRDATNVRAAIRVSPNTMAVRRRSGMERRVLLLIRSGGEESGRLVSTTRAGRDRLPTPSLQRTDCFAELRDAAKTARLAIQPIASPYMSNDELLLLGWLAQAQRVAMPTIDMPRDPALKLAVVRCAGLLDAGGFRLSPFTIYAARSNGKGGRDEA